MKRNTSLGLVFAAGAAIGVPALGAQVYVQPGATLTAENDSNLDLNPGGPNPEVQGYLANASALVGISTPLSDSTIRARIEYRDYPKDSADDRLEEYLDFRSDYSTLRSNASISGTIDHRDDFNAEFSSALFDDLNPVQPTSPSTGRAVTGETLTNVLLQPSYTYKLSPLIGAGVSGVYQRVNYSPTFLDHADFDYYLGNAFVNWNFSQRSSVSFGGFGSKFQATKVDSEATGSGVTASLNTNWSPVLSTNGSVTYQHTNVDILLSSADLLRTSVNTWGASFSAVYKAEISQYRLTLERVVTPSGGGGLYINNQAQFQYKRDFTQRLAFTGAVIALKSAQLPSNFNENNRTYMQTVVELKWMMSPRFFIQGGYQYSWQKFEVNPDGGSNNRVYLRVGYQGLPQQR